MPTLTKKDRQQILVVFYLLKQIKDLEKQVYVYLRLLKKVNISSPTFLDWVDSFKNVYKGNYQTVRKPNEILEYMLKSIKLKTDPNLFYSPSMTNLIDELGNFKSLSESLIDLAENGKVFEAIDISVEASKKCTILEL